MLGRWAGPLSTRTIFGKLRTRWLCRCAAVPAAMAHEFLFSRQQRLQWLTLACCNGVRDGPASAVPVGLRRLLCSDANCARDFWVMYHASSCFLYDSSVPCSCVMWYVSSASQTPNGVFQHHPLLVKCIFTYCRGVRKARLGEIWARSGPSAPEVYTAYGQCPSAAMAYRSSAAAARKTCSQLPLFINNNYITEGG